jgi:hypothetical protein
MGVTEVQNLFIQDNTPRAIDGHSGSPPSV